MDQGYLQELINEARARGGGFILNANEKPAVVVLSIEKYNQILATNVTAQQIPKAVSRKILITGGAGYVGSYVVRQLLAEGHDPVVLDDLSTGKTENIPENVKLYQGSVGDVNFLRDVFASEEFYAVYHFAESFSGVGANIAYELLQTNMVWTTTLLSVMREAGVTRLVYSSTAEVYGQQETLPISESAKLSPVNAYGYSKLLAERVVKYYCHFLGLQAVVFRYTCACGSTPGGPAPMADDFLQKAILVAEGKEPFVSVWGSTYASHDGTPVRDYVHVTEVARAHVSALKALDSNPGKYDIYNIGTGKGYSIKEVVQKISEIFNKIIPMEMAGAKSEIAAALVLDRTKLEQELGFAPTNTDIDTMLSQIFEEAKVKSTTNTY